MGMITPMAKFVTKSTRSTSAATSAVRSSRVPVKGYDAKGRRVWTDDERKVLRSLTKQARVYRSTDATA